LERRLLGHRHLGSERLPAELRPEILSPPFEGRLPKVRVEPGRLPGCLCQIPAMDEQIRRLQVYEPCPRDLPERKLHRPFEGTLTAPCLQQRLCRLTVRSRP